MEPSNLKSILESVLFVANKPLSVKDFAKLLGQQAFAIQGALDQLVEERKDSGIVLLENNGWYQLATQPTNTTIVKDFLNADLREKLTDATVEVLSIIAYRQPISKAEIEAIRGVSSQYSIRHLLMRGLIEKVPNPNDARGFLYETTTEFLQHLGMTSVRDLPEFEKLVANIKLPETPAMNQNTLDEEQENKQSSGEDTTPTSENENPENIEMDPKDPAIALGTEDPQTPEATKQEGDITVITEDIQDLQEGNNLPTEILIDHPTEILTEMPETGQESDKGEDEV
jgi:segregation and condensation protein B